MNIVFMGTPDFAVPSLDILLHNNYNVVAVVTAPDKPAGRGKQIHESAIKQYSIARNLNVLQPEKLKSPVFIELLKALKPDLFIVVAFRMLPEEVWKIPTIGTFNLHGSLLPQYRGAAPINRAIINGEKETGVTTFIIDKEIDTGRILFTHKVDIGDDTTAGELHDELMIRGALLVLKTVKAIEKNEIKPIDQNELINKEEELKLAPKINKEDCRINWSRPAVEIHNFIRGLSPYPAAWCYIAQNNNPDKNSVKIFKSSVLKSDETSTPGTVLTDGKKYIYIATGNGLIELKEIQLEGKKRLLVEEFLRGFKEIENFKFE